jgi:hypothetical protein
MSKLISFSTLAVLATAALEHPVRHEIVEEIKLKATSWTPRDVESNHLRHIPAESIHKTMGSMGMSPFSNTAQKMGQYLNKATSIAGMFSEMVGYK